MPEPKKAVQSAISRGGVRVVLPDFLKDFEVSLCVQKEGEKKPTKEVKGTIKAMSDGHAVMQAPKKFGVVRRSATRNVWYEAKEKKPAK